MQDPHGLATLQQQQHHGGLSQPQSQQLAGEEQGSPGSEQQDILTQQLHQVLLGDTARFWSTTVAPSTQAIAQVWTSRGAPVLPCMVCVSLFTNQNLCRSKQHAATISIKSAALLCNHSRSAPLATARGKQADMTASVGSIEHCIQACMHQE